jgi:hypothetical protein
VEEKLLILQENLSSLPGLVEFVMLSLYYSDKLFVNHCLYFVGLCIEKLVNLILVKIFVFCMDFHINQ